ncbi:MAG: large conductance mechanosensitive channel protein MscL [Clostridia bacterium]
MKKIKIKKSTFLTDFKAFITKGNIVDLAVAVVIGAAFSAIVNSLVKDIVMPLLTLAMGGNGIAGAALVLNGVDQYLANGSVNPAAILWNYGNFIQAVINFLVIALCIFTSLRLMMNLKKGAGSIVDKQKKHIEKMLKKGKITAEEAASKNAELEVAPKEAEVVVAAETTDDILKEIRDLLKLQAKIENVEIDKAEETCNKN